MAGSSSTKAPNSAVRVTLPVATVPAGYFVSMSSHGLGSSCFMPRPSFIFSRSMRSTFTFTDWPGCSTLVASATRVQLISLTCTRPSTPPRSTKAPKSFTERTIPWRTWPSASSFQSFALFSSRSLSSSARRLTTRLRSSGFTSATTQRSRWLTYCSTFSTRNSSMWLMGMKPRMPLTSTSSPPLLVAVTRASTIMPSATLDQSA